MSKDEPPVPPSQSIADILSNIDEVRRQRERPSEDPLGDIIRVLAASDEQSTSMPENPKSGYQNALDILADSAASGMEAKLRADQEKAMGETPRQTLERVVDQASITAPAPTPNNKTFWQQFWRYTDHAVLGLFELLGLLFGLPFGDDLYHDKPVSNLHLVYLFIGCLFAAGGPMFPLTREISWLPKWVAPSISNAARDAKVWIAVLLLFFLYGVAPDIYRRATISAAVTAAPSPAKNMPPSPPNLGRTSWSNLYNGFTQPGQLKQLSGWWIIVTAPPENAEAEKELNNLFMLSSNLSKTLRLAGLPDYSRDLDAPKLEGKGLRGITVHGRNEAADFVAATLSLCFVVLRTAEIPAGLFDYYHRQSSTTFPDDKFVWLEIGNGSPWKGNCSG